MISSTTNMNLLSPLNYRFKLVRAPSVEFFLQKVNIPEIRLPNPDTSNPFVTIPYPGDHIKFGELHIEFKVDEDMKNYRELFEWIQGLGFPDNYNQYKNLASNESYTGKGIYSDISLIVLSSKNNTNFEIIYKDAFPIALGEIQFNTSDVNLTYISCKCTFRYTSFSISKPGECHID
jgi:hypothetical protein